MLATSAATAHDTLHYAADKIETSLQPTARAIAIAKTFRELGDSAAGDLPLTPGDLAAGMTILAESSLVSELPQVTARRKTCSEIAALLRPVAAGNHLHLAAVFRAVASHYGSSQDSRQRAIAATATREAIELEVRS